MKSLYEEWWINTKGFLTNLSDETFYSVWKENFKLFSLSCTIFLVKIIATVFAPIFSVFKMISDRSSEKVLKELSENLREGIFNQSQSVEEDEK